MGLTSTVCVTVHDVECEVEVDDEEIIEYVLENSQVFAAIMDRSLACGLRRLRLLCPYLNIEWKKA